jgi:hypothetical protein
LVRHADPRKSGVSASAFPTVIIYPAGTQRCHNVENMLTEGWIYIFQSWKTIRFQHCSNTWFQHWCNFNCLS